MKFELGKEAKDEITGFKGIIVGRAEYLFGCNQYGLAPKAGKDSSFKHTEWFDEGRIKIISKGVSREAVIAEKPGGERVPTARNHPR